MQKSEYHQSVMISEVINVLSVKPNKISPELYIDATLGTGGYAEAILKSGGKVLGIDADPEMVAIASQRLKKFKDSFVAVVANFRDLSEIVSQNGFENPKAVIFDLGISNLHFKDTTRGFSFSDPNADLDMRLNPKLQNVKGSDLLNVLRPDQLIQLFLPVMGWKPAKYLSEAIIKRRSVLPFSKVRDLLAVSEVVAKKKSLNQATLPFLALRIAVNSEMENLTAGLSQAFEILKPGGYVLVVSFHSLEEKIVEDFAKKLIKEGFVKKGIEKIRVSPKEAEENQKSRSAYLTVIRKI